jgi:DnaK suppressor protein
MTDLIDQASELESLQREMALKAALSKPLESQEIDAFGHHYCNDCGIQIPPQRIAAVPYAVCCVECQTLREHIREQRGKHFV